MITRAQARELARKAIRDLRLVVYKPTGTDITADIKRGEDLIVFHVSEMLADVRNKDVGEKLEGALEIAIAGIAGFRSGMHHAKQMVEVGVVPDMEVFDHTRVRVEDLEIVW